MNNIKITCPYCNTNIPIGAIFCPNCGQKLNNKPYNNENIENDTINIFCSIILSIILGILFAVILAFIFPPVYKNPLIYSCLISYTLHPLCRYKFQFKKAYAKQNIIVRLIIGFIIFGMIFSLASLGNKMKQSTEKQRINITQASEVDIPQSALQYNDLGLKYLRNNNLTTAKDYFYKAFSIAPNFDDANYNLSICYFKEHNYQEGLKYVDNAIQLAQNKSDYYATRSSAYIYKGQNNLAIKDLNKAIQLNNFIKQSSFYSTRATLYILQENYQKALNDLNKAYELDTTFRTNAEFYTNRGTCYMMLGNYQLALSDYNNAITLAPRTITNYSNRGILYYQMGYFNEAIRDFKYRLNIDPNCEICKQFIEECKKEL